jgi:hypothetical protein
MSDVVNALQAAIFARLDGDAALAGLIGVDAVFDHRRTGRAMPYVVISEIETSDFGPDAEEHRLLIEAWSDKAGRAEIQAIAARIRTLLDEAEPVLSGFHLVHLQHRTSRVRREPKSRALVAEISFRAVTEQG